MFVGKCFTWVRLDQFGCLVVKSELNFMKRNIGRKNPENLGKLYVLFYRPYV